MTGQVLLFIFLLIATVLDIRSRRIPALLFVIFGAAGIIVRVFVIMDQSQSPSIMEALFGIMIGAVFIGISLISDGKLGMGDAIAILVTGIYLTGSGTAFTVLYAMLLSALFSIVLLALHKGTRKTELPFLPFLLAGFLSQQIGELL